MKLEDDLRVRKGEPALAVALDRVVEDVVAMIDHPGNPGYPTLWRIDGQFGVGPALARRGDIKIPRDKSLTYRYRLVVYEGDDFRTPLVEQAMKGFDAR